MTQRRGREAGASTDPVDSTGGRSRRPDRPRREQLVAAAVRVVARDGVAAATTRRIAEEAGVPQGLVHYWFTGKEELLEETLLNYLKEFEAGAEAGAGAGAEGGAQAGPAGANDVLQRLGAAFDVVRADDPGRQIAMYELTTWALRTEGKRELAARQYRAYHELAATLAGPWLAQHRDQLPVAAHVVVQFLSAVFDGLVLAWLADPDSAEPEQVLTLLSNLLQALDRPA